MKKFDVKEFYGSAAPMSVGKLRYEKYVLSQSKTYPSADHENRVLFDDADPVSVHMVCFDEEGAICSALRLTPFKTALDLAFFDPLVAQIEEGRRFSVVLSRLVRADTISGAQSIQHMFKYCFDYCLKQDWTLGVLHTSPALLPLFRKYGWRAISDEYSDRYAGKQIVLSLDALDLSYLSEIKSPYLCTTQQKRVVSYA